MEITVQDIKNMFDNNYRAFLGEDRISDIAGILYNSPTARNNLQQMKNYNDRKGISSNGTIILTNNAVIPTARATEGPGGVGIVVINSNFINRISSSTNHDKILSAIIARETGAYNVISNSFESDPNSSIGKILENRARIEGAQTEAQRKAENEIGVTINTSSSVRNIINELNNSNSPLANERENSVDTYYLHVGKQYMDNNSELAPNKVITQDVIFDRAVHGYLDDIRIEDNHAQKSGDSSFFDDKNKLENVIKRSSLENSDIINNGDGSYEIKLRDTHGYPIGDIRVRDNNNGNGLKELKYTDYPGTNADGSSFNGLGITMKSDPVTGHISEVTIVDNDRRTVETIHFDKNSLFGKIRGVDDYSSEPRPGDNIYPNISKRERIDYSHLLNDGYIEHTTTIYDKNGVPKSETSQISLSDIGDAIGKVLPDFLKKPSTWGHLLTGNWTGLLREMFFHQIDPLALDLNGNGIETLAANGHDDALFDHERLGIRTATGWIHSNDGILVYDRNGDGKINDGGEIFGDNTLLKNGKTAAHGFEAAADLDDNGDGKLDAADSAFDKLGVWRDLNHNGISEEGEIFALKDLRIKSLNLGYTQADKDLGNGNTLAEVGSYTDEDGNEHIMGDLRLSADRLHSRYSNSIPLTDEQQQEVNLRGSGRLRDLREAAAQSSELAEVLQQYKNAASKEEQLALRHKLLKAWADTDPQRVEDFKSAINTMHSMTQGGGRKGIGLTPSQVKHMNEIMVMGFWKVLGQPDPAGQKQAELNRRIAILDAFTGTRSPNLYYFSKKEAQHIVDTVNDTYERLADSLYDGLLFQTRLRPYLDAMRLGISEEGKYSIDTATSPHASPKFTRKIPAKPSPTLANC